MSAADRRDEWRDTVFAAINVLRQALRARIDPQAFAAAELVLKLESARMRHGQPVGGPEPSPAFAPPSVGRYPEQDRRVAEGDRRGRVEVAGDDRAERADGGRRRGGAESLEHPLLRRQGADEGGAG